MDKDLNEIHEQIAVLHDERKEAIGEVVREATAGTLTRSDLDRHFRCDGQRAEQQRALYAQLAEVEEFSLHAGRLVELLEQQRVLCARVAQDGDIKDMVRLVELLEEMGAVIQEKQNEITLKDRLGGSDIA